MDKVIMKTYQSVVKITKELGIPLSDYIKVASFLNLVHAPMAINEFRVNTYTLTDDQIEFLKEHLEKIKIELKK